MQGSFFPDYQIALDHYINQTRLDSIEYKLVFLKASDPSGDAFSNSMIEMQWDPRLETLRKDEFSSVEVQANDGSNFIVSYSVQAYALVESKINICRTTFIVFVLGMASIYFTKDA